MSVVRHTDEKSMTMVTIVPETDAGQEYL